VVHWKPFFHAVSGCIAYVSMGFLYLMA
jgi:hypothetical protein